jgi:hypothetical protein
MEGNFCDFIEFCYNAAGTVGLNQTGLSQPNCHKAKKSKLPEEIRNSSDYSEH